MRSPIRSLTAPGLLFSLLAVLGGCGFHLRGAVSLPYETMYIAADQTLPIANELRRAVLRGSGTRLVESQAAAQATLYVVDERREKVIQTLSGGGRVREYQLRYRVTYRVIDSQKHELRPRTQIQLSRDLSYNDTDTISKESEEALLYRDMQSDAVSQIFRQLQTRQQAAAQ